MIRDQAVLRKDGWHFYLDGMEVQEATYQERYPPPRNEGVPMGPSSAGWPLVSECAAVDASQVKEATEHAATVGVPTDFDALGRPIFRDRDHRSRYLKAYGFYDRDAGYGDATRGDSKGRFDRPEPTDFSEGAIAVTRRQR